MVEIFVEMGIGLIGFIVDMLDVFVRCKFCFMLVEMLVFRLVY